MFTFQGYLNIFMVLVVCIGAQSASATSGDRQQQQLESILNSVGTKMAPAFEQEWKYILDKEHTFKIFHNKDQSECLSITRRMPRDAIGSRSRLRYYEISTKESCLADSTVDWEIELQRETTKWWFKNINVKLRSRLISLVYSQNFFNIYDKYPFNLETDLESMVAEFFALTGQALLQDRTNFERSYSDAAKLVEAVAFDGIRDLDKINSLKFEGSSKSHPLFAKVKMLAKSNEAWFIRYNMIKNAKKSIRIQSYSLFDDLYGRATVALLLEAIERGVKVKMSLDGRGSIMTSRSDLVELLVHRGAEVSSYNPLFWNALNLYKFFYAGPIDGIMSSNHDKIMIVDDSKVLTGGRNIGNRYFITQGEDDGKVYQDMDVYAECESFPFAAVVAFNIEFYSSNAINVSTILTRKKKYTQVMEALRTLESKMLGRPILPEDEKNYPEINRIQSAAAYRNFDPRPEPTPQLIEGLDKTSSLIGKNVLTDEIFRNIDNAMESISIVNPYVILSTEMKAHLVAAGKRGVQIIIVTTSPTSTDSTLTQARLIDEWKSILTDIPYSRLFGATGPTKLHAKSFVFDSRISIVGSYNLDLLSQEVNSEFALKITSESFAKELEDFILDYAFNKSLEYNVAKNIGPQSQPNGQKKFKSMNRLRFLSRILRPIL